MEALGWERPDFVFVTGDAYRGPSRASGRQSVAAFGTLRDKARILAQPEWKQDRDFTRFGTPALGFLVTAGNLDSMVAHYTVAKNAAGGRLFPRTEDRASPGPQ